MAEGNSVLEQWLEQEAQVRARIQRFDVVTPDIMKARSGAEILQAMLAGEIPPPPITDTLDFILVEGEPGRVAFQGAPAQKHYNPMGSVHGGYFCTLLDSAVGCAVHSVLPKGVGYTTLEIKVNLVRAMTARTGPVRAEGKVIQVGSRVGTAEGRIVDANGKLYAHATTTCLIFPLP